MKPDRPPAPAPAYEQETRAMLKISRILAELPLDGRARVVQFVAAQFGAPPEREPS